MFPVELPLVLPVRDLASQAVINKFSGMIESSKIDLVCNAEVGRDVSVAELRELFHVVRFLSHSLAAPNRDFPAPLSWLLTGASGIR